MKSAGGKEVVSKEEAKAGDAPTLAERRKFQFGSFIALFHLSWLALALANAASKPPGTLSCSQS